MSHRPASPPGMMSLMAGGLDGGALEAVRDYTCEVLGCSPDRITAVSPLEGGNRHAVYKVSCLGATGPQEVVVRVSYGGDPDECIQAEREARVLQTLGGPAAPLLYDFRLTSPWFGTPTMCMQFLTGHQRQLSSASPRDLERLGSVVAWVHGRRTSELHDTLGAADEMASYAEARVRQILSTSHWVRDPLPAGIQARLRSTAEAVKTGSGARRGSERFDTGEPLCLLHGDIGPGNILWGPDPVLIDWEYARLGDPADEIAYLFDQNGLSAPQRQAFWRGYRGDIESQALLRVASRVDWWEPVTLLGSTLWWVERWVRRADADAAGTVDPAAPREPGYYLDHVVRRLDRFDSLLAGRR